MIWYDASLREFLIAEQLCKCAIHTYKADITNPHQPNKRWVYCKLSSLSFLVLLMLRPSFRLVLAGL